MQDKGSLFYAYDMGTLCIRYEYGLVRCKVLRKYSYLSAMFRLCIGYVLRIISSYSDVGKGRLGIRELDLLLFGKRSPKLKSLPKMPINRHIGMYFCKSEPPMQKVPVADFL